MTDREEFESTADTSEIEGAPDERERLGGADEIDFLRSRKDLAPFDETLARDRSNQLARRAEHFDGTLAGEAHEQGELLNEFYLRHGDHVLGHTSFADWLETCWPLDVSVAYQRMRIGRFFTRTEAIEWKASKCDYALRLIAALGLREEVARRHPDEELDAGSLGRRALELLLETELTLSDGSRITFPAPVNDLKDALRVIKRAAREDEDDGTTVGRRVERHRTAIRALASEHPEIAALKPTVSVKDGQIAYGMKPVGRKGLAAAKRLIEELERLR